MPFLRTRGRLPFERFLEKTQLNERTGCLEWLGALNSKGYGVFSSGPRGPGRLVYAHRWALKEFGRVEIEDVLTVDHTCGNTRCVNWDHLEVVTRSENSLRMHERRNKEAIAAYAAYWEALGEKLAACPLVEDSDFDLDPFL